MTLSSLPEYGAAIRDRYRKADFRYPAGESTQGCNPILTFAGWQENQPGFLEIDAVAHCGDKLEGFY